MNETRNRNFRNNRPRPQGDRGNNGGARFRQRPSGPHQGRQHANGSGNNAQRNYERYIALAREAALSGDSVEMENCYQHAEHYFRVMKDRSAN
jgi:uncharacterized protein DUF4167